MRISRQHFRLAFRSFARSPAFAATAVLSLALAIALNTTMYSVLDALVNPEIDARQPTRLYRIQTWGDYKHRVQQEARAQMLRDLSSIYESMTYVSGNWLKVGVEYGNRYAQVSPLTVAPNYFDVTRIGPSRGRSFTTADITAEMQPVIINERLASTLSPERDFPIGARVDIDGVAHPVIGVVHQGSSLYILPAATTSLAALPGNFLRLRDGVTPQDAERQTVVISNRLADAAGEDRKATGFLLKRADAGQFHIGNFHYALIAAVIAVLIIACANLANLQLARGIARSRELALRAALGASRADIIIQLLIESFALSAVGLVAGLVATFWAIHLVAARIPTAVAQYVVTPQVSWRLFVVAMVACLVATVLIGLYPAIKVSRADPNELLKAGAGTGATRKHRRQYGVMVITEIGLALALLSGAAIVVRSALTVHEIRMGFDPKPLARATIYLRADRDTVFSRLGYANQLLASIRSIPGVSDATIYESGGVGMTVSVEQHNGPPLSVYSPGLGYRLVSPSYLRTFHLPVTKGRDFLDGSTNEREAIVEPAHGRTTLAGRRSDRFACEAGRFCLGSALDSRRRGRAGAIESVRRCAIEHHERGVSGRRHLCRGGGERHAEIASRADHHGEYRRAFRDRSGTSPRHDATLHPALLAGLVDRHCLDGRRDAARATAPEPRFRGVAVRPLCRVGLGARRARHLRDRQSLCE